MSAEAAGPAGGLSAAEAKFVHRAIRRRPLFLGLSILGIVVAAAVVLYDTTRHLQQPAHRVGSHAVIVLLVLLNARQNLRQYRYAGILDRLLA